MLGLSTQTTELGLFVVFELVVEFVVSFLQENKVLVKAKAINSFFIMKMNLTVQK